MLLQTSHILLISFFLSLWVVVQALKREAKDRSVRARDMFSTMNVREGSELFIAFIVIWIVIYGVILLVSHIAM